jgi:hypothetical protein
MKIGFSLFKSLRCFVLRPETRARHSLKLELFKCRRIRRITSDSVMPSFCLISSNDTSSAQASEMISLIKPSEYSGRFITAGFHASRFKIKKIKLRIIFSKGTDRSKTRGHFFFEWKKSSCCIWPEEAIPRSLNLYQRDAILRERYS